ncbi:sigma-70 family RNA polymerase sigma factor [Microbacterium sp. ZW T5_45]|uniref:RNA polymerase sigma factor n=1 Tax=Microbacterium sp. ZW T5_45 TaxID=3378080 RepID=UPI003854222F
MEDSRTDAELLSQLRDGDQASYVVLWERHVGAALRYANRTYRSRAEDLVSEAFLAVYQQVTTSGKGPDFAFFAYLKAVMRNTAIRWRKEEQRVDDTVEADDVDFRDALSLVEREASANDLLGAFQELPERWQRVLWLSEVAEVARPVIAEELGIKPNAVSALHRRARSGLKLQWLTRQVPVALRLDETHVARLLPRHLTEPDDAALQAEVSTHLTTCTTCSDLLITLRSDARRLQSVTLSAVGFGALGVAIPSGTALAPGTAAAALLLTGSGIGIGSWLLGGASALTIGGILFASLLTLTSPASSDPTAALSETVKPAASTAQPVGPATPQLDAGGVQPSPDPVVDTDPDPAPPRTGRFVDDPTVDSVDLVEDPDAAYPTYPDRPTTAPDDAPDPTEEPNPETPLTPGVSTPTEVSGYFAPVIGGTASPGSAVVVEMEEERYAPAVAEDGTWTFDPRGLQLPAGTYAYRAWAYDEVEQSSATSGSFTVMPVDVTGFEGLTGFEDMLVSEASTTGLVVEIAGPPNGTVHVGSMAGPSALIVLDDDGIVRKRLRMDSWGWYWMTFRAMDADGYASGAITERGVDVYDPDVIWSPWGPAPEDMTFEFVDE